MAVTVTPVLAGATLNVSDVEATQDADDTAIVPHGLGVVPVVVTFTPLLRDLAAASQWAATSIDATNITLNKSIAGGSGGAGAQIRVIAATPHSLFL